MRRKRITTAALAATLLATGLAPLALSTPAAAAAAKFADDFNGDGYRDYAEYSYGADYEFSGGAVKITFGTANGPGTKVQYVSQNSAGVPGSDEADDLFGEVRAAADFNADGYGDLAVAATGEDVAGRVNQGTVTVLWGSRSGLSGGTNIPARSNTSYGRMGADLAVGDFNGDGKKDLALVAGGKAWVYRGTISRSGVAGSVTALDKDNIYFEVTGLVAGNVTGDNKTDLVVIGDVVTDTYIASDAWFIKGGTTLAPGRTLRLERKNGSGGESERGGDGVIADFNKDGKGDIAIGTPLFSSYRGEVSVWYGAAAGPAKSARFTQNTAGVADTAETYDSFGEDLVAGDINGDGYRDLAIGAYGERIGNKPYAGAVHVLYGRAAGLTTAGSQWFARNSAGIPGEVTDGDMFGAKLRLRDANRDGRADLYVSGGTGSLRLLGSPSGITTAGVSAVPEGLIDGMLP
ncbi:FG-GAP and VCBS repeat-containing protein [Streptomyces turgidiscabies]|uniref:FG-GAP repeat protein n=1 Tax=Streptomyces turgidiscabies (strain Car8) TaxID=698760 RepID=L7EW95_STRT8|nr:MULTISPECIES: FG-GAP and VCBS repeat-containing protein [Streptomyces]ELP62655.1 FG-GAP repeat protein [Streptomyces turgidiscabies Car8]MDX3492469.1 FG-GAP and VCBS repeat-containing protein [Streptomyces turgidiscabies]GAQ69237.1 FG-GAP repeat protein [Streptomyces turgidiscabies]